MRPTLKFTIAMTFYSTKFPNVFIPSDKDSHQQCLLRPKDLHSIENEQIKPKTSTDTD